MNYFSLMSISMLIITSLLSIQTKSWVIIWVQLELNTASFFFITMKMKKKSQLILFFLFQSISSIILMIFLFSMILPSYNENSKNMYLIMLSMMAKMGMYPFYSWIINISKNFSWMINLIIMTWQKLIPTLIIMKMTLTNSMMLMITLSILMMTMIMVKMSTMKMIIMSSSLINSGWMLIPIKMILWFPMMYLAMYSIVIIQIIKTMENNNLNSFMFQMKQTNYVKMIILILSMSGIPPLVMFLLKIMIFYVILKMNISMLIWFSLVIVASLSFFTYSQMIFKELMKMNIKKHKKINSNMKNLSLCMLYNFITPLLVFTFL